MFSQRGCFIYDQYMMLVNKVEEKSHLGAWQRPISFFFFIFYQLAFHGPVTIFIYTAITLDINLIVILIAVTFIQLPVRRWQRYINFVNKYLQPLKYFNKFVIIHEEPINEKDHCIFGVHPHSVFGLSLLSLMNCTGEGPLANMIGLSSRFILNFPFSGALLKLWGFQAVNHKNLKKLMQEGHNIGMLPGGFEQATITTASEMRIWIENRKGFIKYALDHGYTIYPVIMMNQHKAYWTFEYFLKFRLFLNKFKLPGVLFWNFWTGLFIPPWLDMHLIIGRGIRVTLKEGETVNQELVESTHKTYIAEIQRIYEKHGHLNSNSPLKIY